ncbi:MAG: RES family NAD+ phosphorylase [Betaproteobacteria bacterium]|nr:RES family NAD+ phosphorylase [Betaproteobacteria bacterium]
MTATVPLWRIAAETRDYKATDLSGHGAAKYPGRWNAHGERVVYAATSLALAVLETAAHLDDAGLPLNRFVVQLTIPVAVWGARQELQAPALDPGWAAIPAGRASVDIGSAWYKSARCALLLVPSVVVPEEQAVLINALHSDAKTIKARTLRRFDYNSLFRS